LLLLRAKKLGYVMRRKHLRGLFLHWRVAPSLELTEVLPPYVNTVLDVGANRGQFTLLAREMYPSANIIAFEAQPKLREALARLAGFDAHLDVHNVALGSSSGTSTLHISGKDDSSSLLAIGPRQAAEFPGTAAVTEVTVELARLDDVLSHSQLRAPTLLKLDVQGFELEVLRGSEGLLPWVEWILVECSFVELYTGQPLVGDIVQWMSTHGYRLVRVGEPWSGRNGQPLQADFLFRQLPSSPRP